MPYVSSISALLTSMNALADTEFAAEERPNIVYGAREPQKGQNQGGGGANRIIIAPGDDKDKAGSYGPPKQAARNPRSIATFHETFRVYIWAQDGDSANRRDELKQDEACRTLHEWVVRAIRLAARGTYELKDPTWVRGATDRARLGSELRVLLHLELAIFDTPFAATSTSTPPEALITHVFEGANGDEPGCI